MKKKRRTAKKPVRPARRSVRKPVGWPKSSLDPNREVIVVQQGSQEEREAGQSGDTARLSDVAEADSESVKELVEEGQDFEAEIINGVERAGEAGETRAFARRRKREKTP